MPQSDRTRLLAHLVELFADKDKTVRVEAVRAVEQVGSTSASLAAPSASCCSARTNRKSSARATAASCASKAGAPSPGSPFSGDADDAAAEAALAIAGTHSAAGFEALQEASTIRTSNANDDPWFRSVLLSAIALTRQDAALEFLLDLVARNRSKPKPAIEAVLRSMPSPEVVKRLEKLVARNRA